MACSVDVGIMTPPKPFAPWTC